MMIARRALAAGAAGMAILIAACGGGSTASTGGADSEASAAPSTVTPSEGGVNIVQELPQDLTSDSDATSSAEGESDEPYVAEESVDVQDKRISVTLGGKATYIKNGGRIILGGGRAVEIFVDPYPPSTLRTWLDLYLTQDGQPIEDASIGIEYDMLSMVHGPFSAAAENVGGGHYLFTLDYIMFGAWDQALTIRLELERIRFPLVLVAYP